MSLFTVSESIKEVNRIGVSELVDRVNLAKSSDYSHLAIMRFRGFVVKRNGEYHLRFEFFQYGQFTRSKHEVYSTA